MTIAQVSDKGQVTLPAKVRRSLGIEPRSRVQIEVRSNEIVIRPAKSIRDVAGVFKDAVKGHPADWEAARRAAVETVVQEYLREEPE